MSCERAHGPTNSQQVATKVVTDSNKWEYIGHGLYIRSYYSWGTRYIIVSDKNGTCVSITCH